MRKAGKQEEEYGFGDSGCGFMIISCLPAFLIQKAQGGGKENSDLVI
jgi:hypothetical protein